MNIENKKYVIDEFFWGFRCFFKVYKLKIIAFFIFLISISGCRLFTGEVQSREIAGKYAILSMNRAQIAYFKEKKEFATTIDELLTIKTETDINLIKSQLNSNSYVFKVALQPSENKSVMHIAQPKLKYIRSHLGLVYVIDINGDDYTITLVCKAENSGFLNSIPTMPKLPINARKSEDIQCPSGFKTLR